MSDDRTPAHQPIYRLRLEPVYSVAVELVVGSETPVKLVLAMQDFQGLERVLEKRPQGATLAIDMNREAALEIFSAIRKLARTMDWPLPKEDGNPS